jgi:hypothetical protein
MQRCSRTATLFLAFCAATILGCDGASGSPEFRIRSVRMAGDELRVILETASRHQPFMSHSSKASNAKGWLITVDLSKDGPIESRARVIGPLWDVPNERSSLSFDAGPIFTKEDAAARQATPFIDLAWDGAVVRIRAEGNGARAMVREHLVLDAKPYWKKDGPFLPLPPPGPPMNEETVTTLSGRYHLQLSGGKTTLHERLTGKRIDDPWLEAAFTACRSIEHFENVRTWLTDDLKYLVSTPEAILNSRGGLYETFTLGGKTYNRGEYALVWQRPRPEPILVKKPRKETMGTPAAMAAGLSLDGRLYFQSRTGGVFSNEAPSATLVPFSDGPRYEIAPPLDRSEWGLVMPDRIQLLEKPTRIAFFGTNDFMSPKARHRVPDEAVTVFIWDLAKGKMSVHDAPTGQLFRSDRGEYVPKQATKIE